MNTHQLQHTTIPLKDHQNRFILSFSPKTSFVSKIFRTFANAIVPFALAEALAYAAHGSSGGNTPRRGGAYFVGNKIVSYD